MGSSQRAHCLDPVIVYYLEWRVIENRGHISWTTVLQIGLAAVHIV